MSTKKNNEKKFKLEMFEAVNLTTMSKIIGGTGFNDPVMNGDGDDTITFTFDPASSIKCEDDDDNGN